MPHPTLITPEIPRGSRPWRLAGPGRRQPFAEDLHLSLSPTDGVCALFVARAQSTITAVYHYDNGRYGPALVIGSGPGEIDTAALKQRFDPGTPLHDTLALLLTLYHVAEVPRRDRAQVRLGAAARVTALFRTQPVVSLPATPAAPRKTPKAFPTGRPIHPVHLADRYLDAVAAVTGVRPPVDHVADPRVLARFLDVTLDAEPVDLLVRSPAAACVIAGTAVNAN